jgi:type VI secretion system secreted protein Hcp
MALDASVKSTGSTQGTFMLALNFNNLGKISSSSAGGGGGKARSGIPCYGFKAAEPEHDPQSGLPTGKRMHKPVSITREVDSASPQLLHACNIGETFSSALLQFPQSSSSGKINTLELLDGAIIKIEHPLSKNGKRLERLTLSFNGKKLNGATTHHSGGIEAFWWRDGW